MAKMLTSLPSFNELVTSIPLPVELKKEMSGTSSSTLSIPTPASSTLLYGYYDSPDYQYQYQYPQYVRPQLNTPELYESRSGSALSSCSSPTSETSEETESSQIKDPKRKHICKVCTRSFTTSGHLARHNRIHTGERKHICPWASCDARFARQDNCMQHYKTHTNGKNKRSKGKY